MIDRFQLRQAVEHMQWLHRTLGELAERRGFMTKETVERVLVAQLESDARFGEMAMELGCLSQLELDELIEDQIGRQVRIGESLVELGHLDEAEMKDLVGRFEAEQAELVLRPERMPEALRDDTLVIDVLDRAPKTALRTALLPIKLGIPVEWTGDTEHALRFSLVIEGDDGARIGVATDERLGHELASGRLGNHSPAPEIIEDVLCAFLRTVAQLCARGRALGELDRSLPDGGFAFPIASPTGAGTLIIDPAR